MLLLICFHSFLFGHQSYKSHSCLRVQRKRSREVIFSVPVSCFLPSVGINLYLWRWQPPKRFIASETSQFSVTDWIFITSRPGWFYGFLSYHMSWISFFHQLLVFLCFICLIAFGLWMHIVYFPFFHLFSLYPILIKILASSAISSNSSLVNQSSSLRASIVICLRPKVSGCELISKHEV